jgi:TPR repeat protein
MSSDPLEAKKWFLKAAEQGYPPAQYAIGDYHLEWSNLVTKLVCATQSPSGLSIARLLLSA